MLESRHFCGNCQKTRAFESTNWYLEALAFLSTQCRLPPPQGKVFRETEEIEGVINYDWAAAYSKQTTENSRMPHSHCVQSLHIQLIN